MLTYLLDQRGHRPAYEYLSCSLLADILSGRLSAHEKLPSKRSLARQLGISVVTVQAAYSQLVAEGYLRSQERRGYFVNPVARCLPAASPAPLLPKLSCPLTRTPLSMKALGSLRACALPQSYLYSQSGLSAFLLIQVSVAKA